VCSKLTGGLSSTCAFGTAGELPGNALSKSLRLPHQRLQLPHTHEGRLVWRILARIAPVPAGTPFDDIAPRLLPLGDPEAARPPAGGPARRSPQVSPASCPAVDVACELPTPLRRR